MGGVTRGDAVMLALIPGWSGLRNRVPLAGECVGRPRLRPSAAGPRTPVVPWEVGGRITRRGFSRPLGPPLAWPVWLSLLEMRCLGLVLRAKKTTPRRPSPWGLRVSLENLP